MKTLTIPATKARNNFFKLLETVAHQGCSVVITKNNTKFARIIPEKEVDQSVFSLSDIVNDSYGMAKQGQWPYESKAIKKQNKGENQGW